MIQLSDDSPQCSTRQRVKEVPRSDDLLHGCIHNYAATTQRREIRMSSSSERPPYISESGLLAERVVVLREGTAWSLMFELASRSTGLT